MKVLRALTSGGALMLLAVILGVGTAAAAFVWLDGQADDDTGTASAAATSGPTREVVVLLEDVPAGSPLPQAALALRRVAVSEVLIGASSDLERVAGRVARYPLLAGEQVTEARLVAPGGPTGNGLAYTVATYVSTGWYPDKRGLVSGLCMAFTGGSSAFLAPI
ncbi:MAG: hypothetical protein KC461_15080, partial [Dehalococcoidia bacterium]|nr:hypothetical protein [Dehalococcoidia bacterium]